MTNKLFCTFTSGEELDELVSELSTVYTIMYNKMFVLFVKSTNEYVITYNVDQGNVNSIPENTILVHRKKETNTLYTINALNELIKKLNDGVVDMAYRVNWPHYRNSILLTQHNELKQLNTKVFKIIEL
jgi:DNA-directed RNA polymerase subunit L